MIVRNSIQELAIAGEVEINNLNSAWISSLASYWGCIVGSIISGLLTVIGVFWSIKYYRDSDAVKSRVEHLPFLIARVNIEVHANDIFDPNTQCFNIEHTSSSGEKEVYCFVTLKNIGRSFANTLTVNYGENFGGMEFNRIIQVNDTVNFCFVINLKNFEAIDTLEFSIIYIDCMTNEYIQSYTIKLKEGTHKNVPIDNGYPMFLAQTHAICQ
ncbi:hypothetical protein [Clostridium butyricum]